MITVQTNGRRIEKHSATSYLLVINRDYTIQELVDEIVKDDGGWGNIYLILICRGDEGTRPTPKLIGNTCFGDGVLEVPLRAIHQRQIVAASTRVVFDDTPDKHDYYIYFGGGYTHG